MIIYYLKYEMLVVLYFSIGILFAQPVLPTLESSLNCSSNCFSTHAPINFQVIGDVAIGGIYPFYLSNLRHVTNVRMDIYGINGSVILSQSAYCANGINSALYWDGTISGTPVPNAIYSYAITFSNYCHQQTVTGRIRKLADYTGVSVNNFNIVCYNGANKAPKPCCVNELDISIYNRTLVGPEPGLTSFIVRGNIWASTQQPNSTDPVRVTHNAKVLFKAGQQITLGAGFSTELGAVFSAEIETCPKYQKQQVEQRSLATAGFNKTIQHPVKTFVAYPNPTTGQTQLELGSFYEASQVYKVAVHNTLGEQIHYFETTRSSVTLDLQNYANGIYWIQVSDGSQKYTAKVIKQ